jgi:hypothetical protein
VIQQHACMPMRLDGGTGSLTNHFGDDVAPTVKGWRSDSNGHNHFVAVKIGSGDAGEIQTILHTLTGTSGISHRPVPTLCFALFELSTETVAPPRSSWTLCRTTGAPILKAFQIKKPSSTAARFGCKRCGTHLDSVTRTTSRVLRGKSQ